MRRVYLAILVVVSLAAVPVRASDPIGIYALVEKVALEPREQTPERIQIWGAFVVVTGKGSQHTTPARGYMYFSLAPGKADVCRREWADLKKVAGKGQVVGFGSPRGTRGLVRTPRQRFEPAEPLKPERLTALITELGHDQFAVRERASRELEQQGSHAQPALRRALDEKLMAEARRRVERLLHTEKPDDYPLGFGLIHLESASGHPVVDNLQSLPYPLAPSDGDLVSSGKVTLRTRNIINAEHKNAPYIFEIEGPSGQKETSPPVAVGEKETGWSPRLAIEAGQKYTWRVHAAEGNWKGPVATVRFQGKSVP